MQICLQRVEKRKKYTEITKKQFCDKKIAKKCKGCKIKSVPLNSAQRKLYLYKDKSRTKALECFKYRTLGIKML